MNLDQFEIQITEFFNSIPNLDINTIQNTLVYVAIAFAFYYQGKRKGNSNILVSKKQKLQIQHYKGKKEQSEKIKLTLFRQSQQLSYLLKILTSLIFIGNILVYYFEILSIELQQTILIISIPIIIIIFVLYFIEKQRLANIIKNLQLSEKEIEQIVKDVAFQLGDELMALIKKEIFHKDAIEWTNNLNKKSEEFEKSIEQKYLNQMEELKLQVKSLKDKEFQQKQEIQNFKRSAQSHKTEPIPNVRKQPMEEILQAKIEFLKKELQIQKDMISQVINFEWCPDCTQLENHCIMRYFQQSKQIGETYNQSLQTLMTEKEHLKQQQKQTK